MLNGFHSGQQGVGGYRLVGYLKNNFGPLAFSWSVFFSNISLEMIVSRTDNKFSQKLLSEIKKPIWPYIQDVFKANHFLSFSHEKFLKKYE